MRRTIMATLTALTVSAAPATGEVPVSLRGSQGSMVRQNHIAEGYDLPFVRTPGDLFRLEASGALVRLAGSEDYELSRFARYPLARPELRLFIERLAARYRAATGEKLIVTSLVRPITGQPPNAHALSVHPAGVAVDLRVSRRFASRDWLERTLLGMEEEGLLDVTREYYPPHYHVALFPDAYMRHLEARVAEYAHTRPSVASATRSEPASAASAASVATPPAPLAILLSLPLLLIVPLYRRRSGGEARRGASRGPPRRRCDEGEET